MVYIFLASGFEEVEALYTFDLLKRAGLSVALVNTTDESTPFVTSCHDVSVKTDIFLHEVDITQADALVIPGGLPGADNLSSNSKVIHYITEQIKKNGIVAAICAAPSRVLGVHGLLEGKRFTCYPSEEIPYISGNTSGGGGGHYIQDEAVVQDGMLITSKGVGTVHLFAYAIIERLKDTATADLVFKQTLISK